MASRLDHVLAYVQRTPWAIIPAQGQVIAGILTRRASGVRLTPRAIRELVDDRRAEIEAREVFAAETRSRTGGAVAVIPVAGTIVHRAGSMDDVSGLVSAQSLVRRIRDADADATVSQIVLDVDSPGGTVDGLVEAASAIRATSKPITAVANTMAASAAYWLASQADDIVVTPSGSVGSIGVYTMHTDISGALEQEGVSVTVAAAGKHKGERLPFAPLSDDARAEMEAEVAHYYDLFVADVAAGRGVKTSVVRAGFGEGRMVRGKAAVAAGMADRVLSMEDAIARLTSGGRTRKRARASACVLVQATAEEPSGDPDIRSHVPVGEPACESHEDAPAPDPLDEIEIRERALAPPSVGL